MVEYSTLVAVDVAWVAGLSGKKGGVNVSSEPNRSSDMPPSPPDRVDEPDLSEAAEQVAPGEERLSANASVDESGEAASEDGVESLEAHDAGEAADAVVDEPPEPVEVEPEVEPEAGPEPEDVAPIELIEETEAEDLSRCWYILKVQVNREESIRDALQRRVKIEGLERFFGDVVVPTEDVAEFTKTGKRRIVKRKLYPGYIMVDMAINDDTWFLVRETPGIGDFTGSAGKPTAMDANEVDRILNLGGGDSSDETQVKTAIPFKTGDRVRVKEGYFQNFEGDVESVDEANGRVTVMINIFGRSTPVELEHWHVEAV
ncbi:MAG: transcription termination/antitermination protein NusG [Pirellulaceae bacterium]